MAVLDNLEPKQVFHFFEELCKIPHETFDTKRISDYCVSFAKERGLEVSQDDTNNVIIKKPGTAGYENSEPVILQGHLDMVCEKKPGSDHDFKKDGLKLYVEDGYVRAKDTSLGGDDGIAVAMAMAILDSDDIEHPPIEAVFTVDEETGMGGAEAVDLSQLKGKMLINIDSEEEGILTTGCAGGIFYKTVIPMRKSTAEGTLITIKIHGLLGGHSGNEIHKQRGNANKMMGRLLYRLGKETDLRLTEIFGGSKDNVITMNATAGVLVPTSQAAKVTEMTEDMKKIWLDEFMGEEPGLAVDFETTKDVHMDAYDQDSTKRVIAYLEICPNGLQEYSRKLKGIVESSLNLGVIECDDTSVTTQYLIRSSVESRKQQMREQVEQCALLAGGKGETTGEYPAWQYKQDSKLRPLMIETYKELYGKEPVVSAVHAGLECGLFLGKRPDLDCVSCGPNLLDIHSFNEHLDIASTQRTWEYLLAILKKCK